MLFYDLPTQLHLDLYVPLPLPIPRSLRTSTYKIKYVNICLDHLKLNTGTVLTIERGGSQSVVRTNQLSFTF